MKPHSSRRATNNFVNTLPPVEEQQGDVADVAEGAQEQANARNVARMTARVEPHLRPSSSDDDSSSEEEQRPSSEPGPSTSAAAAWRPTNTTQPVRPPASANHNGEQRQQAMVPATPLQQWRQDALRRNTGHAAGRLVVIMSNPTENSQQHIMPEQPSTSGSVGHSGGIVYVNPPSVNGQDNNNPHGDATSNREAGPSGGRRIPRIPVLPTRHSYNQVVATPPPPAVVPMPSTSWGSVTIERVRSSGPPEFGSYPGTSSSTSAEHYDQEQRAPRQPPQYESVSSTSGEPSLGRATPALVGVIGEGNYRRRTQFPPRPNGAMGRVSYNFLPRAVRSIPWANGPGVAPAAHPDIHGPPQQVVSVSSVSDGEFVVPPLPPPPYARAVSMSRHARLVELFNRNRSDGWRMSHIPDPGHGATPQSDWHGVLAQNQNPPQQGQRVATGRIVHIPEQVPRALIPRDEPEGEEAE